ncbi:MAG: nucleotidyltransferase family protein [FCB group bacterium]|nr:nucleotidyltransferase family protein [FCB group bacterium]
MSIKIPGIILSAGYSSRMVYPKHSALIGGKAFINRIVESMRTAGIEKIIAVFNPQNKIEGDFLPVINHHPEDGQLSSLQTALKNFDCDSGFLLHLVDRPIVNASTFKRLLRPEYDENIIIPSYKGCKGHPVRLPAGFTEEIISAEKGLALRDIINNYKDLVKIIKIDDEGILLNIDTQETLAEYEKLFGKNLK